MIPLWQLGASPDTLDRHAIAAELLGEARTVLDVGGSGGMLARFLPHAHVTVADTHSAADVVLGQGRLPFADDSFDGVTSLDVVEHIPPTERREHVRELRRVSRAAVVLSCPLGTEGHARSEAELARWYRGLRGRGHTYLEEHGALGLPRLEEVESLASELGPHALLFHGDYRDVDRLFRLAASARVRPWIAPALLRACVRRRNTAPEASPTPFTNRVFVVSPPHRAG
jgi:hypothetical protein